VSLEGIKGKKTATQIELLTNAIEEQKKAIMNGAEPAYDEWVKSMGEAERQLEKLNDKVDEGTEKQKEQSEISS
jgi:hypothetical protein